MKSALLAALLLGRLVFGCEYTAFPDINFSGNDLPAQPVATNLSTVDECAALCCAIAPACVAFTLNAGSPGSRMCFLKSSSIVHNANPGAESGAAPTPPPPSCALMNGTACAPAVRGMLHWPFLLFVAANSRSLSPLRPPRSRGPLRGLCATRRRATRTTRLATLRLLRTSRGASCP